MRIAHFFISHLPRQPGHQRFGLPFHQTGQAGIHGFQVVELVKPLSARAQFTGGLGAAQHQHAQHGGLPTAQVDDLRQAVRMLGHPHIVAAQARRQSLGTQSGQRRLYRILVVRDHRLAVGFLVASVHQRVQRERVILGRRDLFFHEGAQHPRLNVVQLDAHAPNPGWRPSPAPTPASGSRR